MATSLLVPRLVAAVLVLLWAGLAVALAVGYRVGGPLDLLVGGSLLIPCVIAAAAVVRPFGPLDRPARLAVGALGTGAALLVAPLLIEVLLDVTAGVRLPVAPSPDTAYAGGLALLATCLFGWAGIAGPPRPGPSGGSRVKVAAAAGIASTLVAGAAFGWAVVGAQAWLDGQAVPPSAWGPVEPASVPGSCNVPAVVGAGARISVTGTATIDSAVVATATIEGVRSGTDERWTGRLDSRFGDGTLAYSRIGPVALLSVDDGAREPVAPGLRLAGPEGLTLDGPIVAIAADPRAPTVAEDLGLELIDGTPARHCRVAVDGDTVLEASVVMRWLAGQDPRTPSRVLNIWRGQLDWWLFGDGQLGRASIDIGGYPGDTWDSSGVAAGLEAELRALDRDAAHRVVPLER